MPMGPAAQWGRMAATSVPVHLATRAAAVGATWMNAGGEVPAIMVAHASTRQALSAASAQLATWGRCVRPRQCPVHLPRAVTGAPADRMAISPMTVPASLVRRLPLGEAAEVGTPQAGLPSILASSSSSSRARVRGPEL